MPTHFGQIEDAVGGRNNIIF